MPSSACCCGQPIRFTDVRAHICPVNKHEIDGLQLAEVGQHKRKKRQQTRIVDLAAEWDLDFQMTRSRSV